MRSINHSLRHIGPGVAPKAGAIRQREWATAIGLEGQLAKPIAECAEKSARDRFHFPFHCVTPPRP